MTFKTIKLLAAALTVAMIMLLSGCAPKAAPEPPKPSVSEPSAPASQPYNKVLPFELPDADGQLISIEDFEGKYVLINFWATWCTYCDQEMPDLQALQDKYADDLVVLLVNVQEKESEVKAYLDRKNLTMLNVMDKKGEVSALYKVTGMPSSYFVTPDQRVIGFVAGMMSYETMEKSLEYVRGEYESSK